MQKFEQNSFFEFCEFGKQIFYKIGNDFLIYNIGKDSIIKRFTTQNVSQFKYLPSRHEILYLNTDEDKLVLKSDEKSSEIISKIQKNNNVWKIFISGPFLVKIFKTSDNLISLSSQLIKIFKNKNKFAATQNFKLSNPILKNYEMLEVRSLNEFTPTEVQHVIENTIQNLISEKPIIKDHLQELNCRLKTYLPQISDPSEFYKAMFHAESLCFLTDLICLNGSSSVRSYLDETANVSDDLLVKFLFDVHTSCDIELLRMIFGRIQHSSKRDSAFKLLQLKVSQIDADFGLTRICLQMFEFFDMNNIKVINFSNY